MLIRYRCILAGLAWMVSSALAGAQEGPAAAPLIGDAIDVRVVNVEVVVTDWRGHRVTSLKPGDFRLKVDGKTVPVEHFTEVRDGRAEAGVVHYQTRIYLRGRTAHVVAALYDPASGEVAAGRVDLEEP